MMTDRAEVITLGGNQLPPTIDMEKVQELYELIKDDEFDYIKFNSVLFALVTYLEKHKVDFATASLPWAELCSGDN